MRANLFRPVLSVYYDYFNAGGFILPWMSTGFFLMVIFWLFDVLWLASAQRRP